MRKLTLREQLMQVPGLTEVAITWLLDFAADGASITVHQSGGRWNIEVRPAYAQPEYDHRWSVAAWNAYVHGEHLTDVERPCMCYACQRKRWECASLRMAIAEGEKLIAGEDDAGKRKSLAALVNNMRERLARLGAPAEGVHA
jgi:hypothetical protein